MIISDSFLLAKFEILILCVTLNLVKSNIYPYSSKIMHVDVTSFIRIPKFLNLPPSHPPTLH